MSGNVECDFCRYKVALRSNACVKRMMCVCIRFSTQSAINLLISHWPDSKTETRKGVCKRRVTSRCPSPARSLKWAATGGVSHVRQRPY